jgi:aminopeptidase-like protein
MSESTTPPMYQWASDLFPFCRSLTGNGVRQTLEYIQNLIPDLSIKSVPTGTQAFDWVVPNEWNIENACILNEAGEKIVDFKDSNLHVVGYSEPVDKWVSLEELSEHLHSLPDQPTAIPYVTSYYNRNWGFCVTHEQRKTMNDGQYRVVIKSSLEPGVMNYGELIIPGETSEEIFLSTDICHPSLGNNEISGPVVATALAQWLQSLQNRRYTYRIIFVPETIGSIYYLSQNHLEMKKKVVAGFVLTCVGDNRSYSYIASRKGDTLADKVVKHTLKHHAPEYRQYSFNYRGSDERQYCSPGIDLPVCLLIRSRFGDYPEYHTSLDNLSLISQEGLSGAFLALQKCLRTLEGNYRWKITTLCEPHLGKHGLYTISGAKKIDFEVLTLKHFLAYADGENDLIDIADLIDVSAETCLNIASTLSSIGLIKPS